MSTPAGWYPDPTNGGRPRYWDGTQWTEQWAPSHSAPSSGEPPRVTRKKPAGWIVAVAIAGALLVAVIIVGSIVDFNAHSPEANCPVPSAKISEITGWTTIEARFAKVPDSPTEWECRYKQTDSDNHVRWVVVEWADRAFWEESDLPYGTTRHDSLLSDGTAVRVYVGPPTPVSGCIPVGSDLFAQAFFESDGVFWHVADSRDPVQESLCGDEVTAHKSAAEQHVLRIADAIVMGRQPRAPDA